MVNHCCAKLPLIQIQAELG